MKKIISLSLLAGFLTLVVHAKDPVIYGDDNRREVYEAEAPLQELAASAATMIHKKDIVIDGDKANLFQINQTSLKTQMESQRPQEEEETEVPEISLKLFEAAQTSGAPSVCANEKYMNQPAAGECSGFLIGPDLLVTAGHCSSIKNFCADFKWVFDFKVDRKTQLAGVDVPAENVYSCKQVVSSALSFDFGLDYALVVLDRKVSNRKPLRIQQQKMAQEGTPLMVIGSPMGLPLKITDGGNIRKGDHPFYFSANLDTFEGNSGSAVFNKETLEVEGILVRGEEDFVLNPTDMCIESKKCTDDECMGEAVTRLASVPELSFQKMLSSAASSGDEAMVEKIVGLKIWVDIFGENGITALMRAAKNQLAGIMEKLIVAGADVNRSDVDGDTPLHHLTMNLSEKNLLTLNLLISAGASLESKNAKGETPLLTAARWLNLSAVKLLIHAGADKNARNAKGENVLDIFRLSGDSQSANELLALGVEAGPGTLIGVSSLQE